MKALDPDALSERFAELGLEISDPGAEGLRIGVDASDAPALLRGLASGGGAPELASMDRLLDLTAIDHGPDAQPVRFEVVYLLGDRDAAATLRVHVAVHDGEVVPSVTSLWRCADWLEREVFDLFGIEFKGHPRLRRLFLEPDFAGTPLRKDFPRQPDLPLPKGAS